MYARAIKLAKKSTHPDFKHSSLVLKGGSVVSWGVNGQTKKQHSERVALGKLWPDHRAGTTMINVRLRRSGTLGLSRPCPGCLEYLKSWGVAKIIYSTPEGFKEERL